MRRMEAPKGSYSALKYQFYLAVMLALVRALLLEGRSVVDAPRRAPAEI